MWLRVALLNFLMAAGLGALLRFAFVEEVPGLDYRNVLHAHSHVAMLGWVYLALYTFLIHSFLTVEQAAAPFYRRLFWVTQFSVLGMLFSFPFQGYGPVSLTFSTLHLAFSVAFAVRFWRELRQSGRGPLSWSQLTAGAALFFLLFSSLGLLGMGPVMALGLQHTPWYFLSVQFYLHFQFYGWFSLALLALFLRHWEESGAPLPDKELRSFFLLFLPAVPLTFGLAVHWATGNGWMLAVNGLGVLLQAAALFVLARPLWPVRGVLRARFARDGRLLIGVALAAFALRILIQLSGLVPAMATIGTTIRKYFIGFIHLQLLGVASCFLLGWALARPGYLTGGRPASAGVVLFLSGFLLSEALLFVQGTALWAGVGFFPVYYEMLFGVSALMPVGILLVLLDNGGNLATS